MRYFEGSTGEVIKRVWVDENDANLAHIKVFLPKENFDSMKDKSFINLEFHYYKPFFSLSKVYHLTDKLTTHSIGGLEALLRYAKEEYKVLRGRRPDGVLWQSEGLYQSILKIENETMTYDLQLLEVGVGHCHFNLGIATKDKSSKMEKMIAAWETNYLIPFLKDVEEHSTVRNYLNS